MTAAGLQETKHSTTTTHLTRTVTVRAGSIVTVLDPRDTTKVIKQVRVKKDLQLTVHRKPNDTDDGGDGGEDDHCDGA